MDKMFNKFRAWNYYSFRIMKVLYHVFQVLVMMLKGSMPDHRSFADGILSFEAFDRLLC